MRASLALLLPLTLLALPVSTLTACNAKKGDGKPSPPAKIDKPVKEIELATITLTVEAEQRLGVRTARVEKKSVASARTLGGEAVVPAGSQVTVAAPTSGTLQAAGGEALRPGEAVEKGQALFVLSLTGADRVRFAESKASLVGTRADAEAAVARARVEREAARINFERAESLAREQVGSAQRLDDARAQLNLAEANLAGAEARRSVLVRSAGSETGASAPIPIESPMSGTLQRVLALPGQVVHAGAPLVEVARHDPIWIRVPVYVGDLSGIDPTRPALIAGLTGHGDGAPRTAKPVVAPPSANPGTATVDLFYELDNAGGELRPGHAVSATLPSAHKEDSLVVPWAAVLHDIHGGSWVYERTAPQVYARRRVQVRHVTDDLAVLARGPKPGAEVVTDGAAELFGAELGTGK
ncbi:MAG: efflux RND transporter periplasmic adaptor subunit [Byssovorax sp.]